MRVDRHEFFWLLSELDWPLCIPFWGHFILIKPDWNMPERFWLASLGHKRVIKSPCKEAWLKPWLSTSEGVSPTATARLRMAFAYYKVELLN